MSNKTLDRTVNFWGAFLGSYVTSGWISIALLLYAASLLVIEIYDTFRG
jgi:hypothetical protein